MPAFPDEVHYGPMIIAPLNMRKVQVRQVLSPQSTAQEDCKHRSIPFSLERISRRSMQELTGLFRRQPISQLDAKLSDTLHTANAGRQLWTQQSCLRCLVSEASHGCEPSIDRARSQAAVLQVNSIARHYDFVEG